MTERKGICILHVDPDTAFQQTIRQLFPPAYQFLPAQNLTTANEILLAQRPSVILTELDMPDGDGLSWLRELRLDASRQQLIIICVTHRSSVRDKVNSFSAGADNYFVKPIDPVTFLTHVRLLLRIRQIMTTR